MKNAQQNNCDDVVDLLVKKYWSESKSELDQKIAQIAQDFVNRGLSNSTIRISKQLHTEFEYIQKLTEYIFKSLKQDFSHIPLDTCKSKISAILESEYKKLIPRTTSRLVEANLGQKSILEQYKNGIIGEMEKAKEKIEIQCALSEKEKLVTKVNGEKWYRSRAIQAALIGLGGLLFVSIVGWLIALYKPDGRSDVGTLVPAAPEIVDDSSPGTAPMGPDIPASVDHNDPESIQRDEELIQPEETEGDVNQPKISPIFKIPERTIPPEEDAGEVNEPKKPELIKRKEKQIEPENK